MIGNEERRKVAEELREFVGARSFASLKLLGRTTVKANELLAKLFGFEYYKSPFEAIEEIDSADVLKLADLIDRPTCRNVHGGREFRCSRCGMTWHLLDKEEPLEEWAHVRKPPFCPGCGAEVIEDD